MIADNIKSITERISRSCEKIGVAPDSVKLICVTKQASVDEMEKAILAGVGIFGENRVQDTLVKFRVIGDRVKWHLIGHLQTNKVKDAVKIFSLIHSVDSVKLAQAIDKEAGKSGKIQNILIQVNTSSEESKFGVSIAEAPDLINNIQRFQNINISGLMTIAPYTNDPETVRPYFTALRNLLNEIDRKFGRRYSILSMGMTGDFEVAIEEGANMVRIGRAIFDADK